MAVKIRLKRLGRRKRPFYRVVAIDSRRRLDGAEIERLGWYNPLAPESENIQLNEERIFHWLKVGAQPTKSVKDLFSRVGINLKWHLMRNGKTAEEIQSELEQWHRQQEEQRRRIEAEEAQRKRDQKSVKTEEIEAASDLDTIEEPRPELSTEEAVVAEEAVPSESAVEDIESTDESAEETVDEESSAGHADTAEESTEEEVSEEEKAGDEVATESSTSESVAEEVTSDGLETDEVTDEQPSSDTEDDKRDEATGDEATKEESDK